MVAHLLLHCGPKNLLYQLCDCTQELVKYLTADFLLSSQLENVVNPDFYYRLALFLCTLTGHPDDFD